MTTFAIEINDAELVVAGPEGLVTTEPGYAVVEGGRITTGAEAAAQARLKPRLTSNRFWADLSLEAATGIAGVDNAAELAYAQLDALWRRIGTDAGDVVLIVPSHYRGEQLGLLLGIAEECRMPVRAMIDVAAAASDRPFPERELVFVDAGLHRVSVVPLEQGDDVSALVEHGLENTGLAGLRDSLAKRLAELFVLSTRFDPLHRAETEQALYDRLEVWLAGLNDSDTIEVMLSHGGEDISLDIKRDQWLGVAGGFYKALVQLIAQTRKPGSHLVVQLSDRLARLPGLAGELTRLDAAEIVTLQPGHAARSVLAAGDALPARGEQVKLLRHFAWRGEAAARGPVVPRAPAPATTHMPAPTHIVYRGVVYAIDAEGVLIGRARADGRRVIVVDDQTAGVSRSHCELALRDGELKLRDLSSYGTFVNERRVAGEETLHPADVIRIGSPGAELTVVTMEAASHG